MTKTFSENLWLLNHLSITDEQRDTAAKPTTALLEAIDIRRVDEIRRGFELPPECLGFVAEIYATLLAPSNGKVRDIVPLSSEKRVLPNETVHLKNEVKTPFLPGRFMFSNGGTVGGAADWIIKDIRVDGRTVLKSPGDLSGDMFNVNAPDGFVIWCVCRELIEVDATYIGDSKEGCSAISAVIGMPI